MSRAIIVDDGYPIKPRMIDTSKHFFDAFGRMEPETSARLIVVAFQNRETETGESWEVPITEESLRSRHKWHFDFNGLDSKGLIFVKGGKVSVTHLFVAKCFTSSPVNNWTGGKP